MNKQPETQPLDEGTARLVLQQIEQARIDKLRAELQAVLVDAGATLIPEVIIRGRSMWTRVLVVDAKNHNRVLLEIENG